MFFSVPALLRQLPVTEAYGAAQAQTSGDRFNLNAAASGTGVIQQAGTDPVTIVVARLINGVLGIVGVIFLILVIRGGLMWMTSGGNEQKIEAAKGQLKTAVIGFVIIATAYSVTFFIVDNIGNQARQQGTVNVGP